MNPAQGNETRIKLIECPRDAMQGWPRFIPTAEKKSYLELLFRVGFDTVDAGSFVSPKAVPQMADTADVMASFAGRPPAGRVLVIVANERGAAEACRQPAVTDIGYPFSVSETFQQRNANRGIAESVLVVERIFRLARAAGKRLVVYISMAFGNPYGDAWSPQLVEERVAMLTALGVPVISLADTVGLASPDQVFTLTANILAAFPGTETGVHLHSRPESSLRKVEAAHSAGCLRFDGAIGGIGGCPMAGDDLVGNMDTLVLTGYFGGLGLLPPFNEVALGESREMAARLFSTL